MSKGQARLGLFEEVVEALGKEYGVSVGEADRKVRRRAALQVDDKTFAFESLGADLIVRLPRERVEELVKSGLGRRSGALRPRQTQEWLAISSESGEKWLGLASEALRFVRDLE